MSALVEEDVLRSVAADTVAVVPSAHLGCLLATSPYSIHDSRYTLPSWALGVGDYTQEDISDFSDEEEEGEDVPPDLSIDPADGVLSVINASSQHRSYFVSVDNCAHIISAEGLDLLGDSASGTRRQFITFVVLLPPNTCMELATLVPKASLSSSSGKKKGKKKKKASSSYRLTDEALASIAVSSDVQECVSVLNADVASSPAIELQSFPLGLSPEQQQQPLGWLCTQSSGGSLTHFAHPSTFHAVDFRCPVGTPVLAVFSGVIVEVRKESTATGVHVSNLFDFNSIMLKKNGEEDVYVEYVHIHHEGVAVAVGDEVEQGQVLCLSGEVGFCPEPHLHLQVQRSQAVDAPSVQISYMGSLFVAGKTYPVY